MRLRAFRGDRVIRPMPCTPVHAAISANGKVFAASFHEGHDRDRLTVAVWRIDGHELRRWEVTSDDKPNYRQDPPPLALDDEGEWIVMMMPGSLVKYDIMSGKKRGSVTGTYARELALGDNRLYSYDDVWRADDLERAKLDDSPVPRAGHRGARGNWRWVVTAEKGRVVVWDRERGRSSHYFRVPGAQHVDFVGGRFVLTIGQDTLHIIDAVDENRSAVPVRSNQLAASRDGRRVLAWGSGVGSIVELDWDADPGTDDPIAKRWDNERPQIVDAMLADLMSRPGFPYDLQKIVCNHPELELALAQWLSPGDAAAMTRKALADPEIANRPEAWRMLATYALAAGDSQHAADAAAEALARDDGDLGILERAIALNRVRDAVPARTWQAHDGGVTGLAFSGDLVVTSGADSRVRTWRASTGERVSSYDCKEPVTCLDVHEGFALVGTQGGRMNLFALDPLERRGKARLVSSAIVSVAFADKHVLAIADDDHLHWLTRELEPVSRHNYRGGYIVIAYPRAARDWGGDTVMLVERSLTRFHQQRRLVTPGFNRYEMPTAISLHGPLVIGTQSGAIWCEETLLHGHAAMIRAIACGGELIASCAFDGSVRWWRNLAPVAVAKHAKVTAIATDGTYVASAGADGTVILWDN